MYHTDVKYEARKENLFTATDGLDYAKFCTS